MARLNQVLDRLEQKVGIAAAVAPQPGAQGRGGGDPDVVHQTAHRHVAQRLQVDQDADADAGVQEVPDDGLALRGQLSAPVGHQDARHPAGLPQRKTRAEHVYPLLIGAVVVERPVIADVAQQPLVGGDGPHHVGLTKAQQVLFALHGWRERLTGNGELGASRDISRRTQGSRPRINSGVRSLLIFNMRVSTDHG